MTATVTQRISIEALSDDFTLQEIIQKLESVGIFTHDVTIRPFDKKSGFKRDPNRMTEDDLERAGAMAIL